MKKILARYHIKTMVLVSISLLSLNSNLYSQNQSSISLPDSLIHASSDSNYSSLTPKNEQEWTTERGISTSVFFKEKLQLSDSIEVFGWHPYWNGEAYKNYNYGLLSTIAYFSYELDPRTGSYKTIHDWKTTSIIDSAKAINSDIEILLTVSNFGGKNNKDFLGEILNKPKRHKTLIDSVNSLLALRGADGIAINFEGVGSSEKKHLTDFVALLNASLKQNNYTLVMTLPAEVSNGGYDVKELDKHVDKFVITTYGYHWEKSTYAGPIAPLNASDMWGNNSVVTTLEEYIKLDLNPSKLIMGIAYFGGMWETASDTAKSEANDFVGNRTYSQIQSYSLNNLKYDTGSESAYYAYFRNDNGVFRQIWFDDASTLASKYDWVLKNKIGGIGIWALGDDDGYTELWELIAEKFGEPLKKDEGGIIAYLEGLFDRIKTNVRHRSALETPEIYLILVALGVLYLIISLLIISVKQFAKKNIKLFYLIPSLILLLSLYFDKDILIDSPIEIPAWDMILLLLATGTLGILLANLIHSFFQGEQNLP